MTKGRLAALVAKVLHGTQVQSDDDDVGPDAVSVNGEGRDDLINAFYAEIDEIREMIDDIQLYVEEMEKKHSAILSARLDDAMTMQEIEFLMAKIEKTANKVHAKFQVIEQSIEQEEQTNKTSCNLRSFQRLRSHYSWKFIEVMTEYKTIQTNYKDRITSELEIFSAGLQTTNEEYERMLKQGNSAVFTQEISKQEAKGTLEDMEADIHADIIKLEKSIRELHYIFMDMAVQKESEDEMLNRFAEQNEELNNFFQANEEFGIAEDEGYENKPRKKKIPIIICLIIVAIIIIITLSLLLS